MTATVLAAKAWFERPLTPLAFEVRPNVIVASSEPAVGLVSATLPVAPAPRRAGLAKARLALAVVATTSRLS